MNMRLVKDGWRPPRPAPSDTATNADLDRRLAPGTLVAGRYRIVGQIGLGGMGVVYKARDEELDVDVALKVLRPDLGTDPEWIARFRRELVLAREITHKNVVRIHDIGESDGLRFLSMSLVEGRSLLTLLEKEGPLPVDRALAIFRQVAEAVQQAHDVGIIHRDLKPGNVLLSPDDTAYITDFGVARSLDRDGMTRAGAIVGTLDYLSPEQVAGDPADARSDIYALGLLLFEMLTAELPFRSASRAETLAQRIAGRARDIADTGVAVPAHVRRLIRRCLERSPARRYAGVRELIADLDGRRAGVLDRVPRAAWAIPALLLVAAVAGVAYRQRTPGPVAAQVAATAPTAVAVLPLVDETGDPSLAWTATGVPEMLAGHLAETPELRVVDSSRVFGMLRDLKLPGPPTDDVTLRRLAELFDVRRLVTGTVRRAGATLRVDLRLASIGSTGEIESRTLSAETPNAGGLFRLVSDLGKQLHAELGAPATPSALGPEAQTASLEAARAYREGRERLLVGDAVEAAPAFERAVAADPRFASALLGLGEAYQALGYHAKAVAAAEKAAASLGSAQTRLAWRVRARLALLRGDPAEAEKVYAELVQRYPNDTEALFDLASAQSSQGAAKKAVATLERLTALDKGDARAWYLLGKSMIQAGDARKAVSDPLVRALALMTQLGNEQGQGDVLHAMGVAHQRLGEYPQAIAKYGDAAAIRQAIGDKRGTAVSLKNRASVQITMGDFAQAEPDLRRAGEVYAKIGDRKGLADVANDLGALHEGRGEYALARKAYQESLRIRRDLGDEQQLAQSYDNVGYVFFLEGEHDNALAYWRQALALREKNGDRRGIVLSTQNMGFLQTAEGRWSEAMKSFLEALQKAREIDLARAQAVSHGNIGLLNQYEGRYDAALSSYAEALKILSGLDDKRGLAEFTIKQAVAFTELGRLSDAKAKLDEAGPWVRETRNNEQSSDYQAALGGWHLAQGEPEAARRAWEKAVELATASGSPTAVLRAKIGRGAALVAIGGAAAAEPDLSAAVARADALGDALLRVRASEALARAELARGRLRAADEAARRAIDLGQRSGWEAGLYRLHALAGRIQEKKGDVAGAASAFAESARGIARVREGLNADLRTSFDGLPAVREVEGWREGHPAVAGR
ncbi:MAG TPA: tetratricopeptide repeat protein [Vicinamibacteria bacterium]